jgi:hypothetical protein
VTLELPDGFDGELDAHTGDGRVRFSDFDVESDTDQRRGTRCANASAPVEGRFAFAPATDRSPFGDLDLSARD